MDESGFTGHNLLDPQQPFFVVASTDINEDDSESILKSSFPGYQGEEFKFQNIWGSNRGRIGLIELARQLSDLSDNIFVWVNDKKFVALTKILDHFIEPYIHNAGYDFYADGFCWKYSNYIHFGFEKFASPDLYESLIQAYQKFSRNSCINELQNLQHYFRTLADSIDNEVTISLNKWHLGQSCSSNITALKILRPLMKFNSQQC